MAKVIGDTGLNYYRHEELEDLTNGQPFFTVSYLPLQSPVATAFIRHDCYALKCVNS